jgi:uncharacterized FlgJ-related protein
MQLEQNKVTSDKKIVSILDYADENLSQVELVIMKNLITKGEK